MRSALPFAPTPAWRQIALVTLLVLLVHAALLGWGLRFGAPAPLPLENHFLTRTIVLAPPTPPAPPPEAPAAPTAAPQAKPSPRPARHAAAPTRATPKPPAPEAAPPPAPAPVLSTRDEAAAEPRVEAGDTTTAPAGDPAATNTASQGAGDGSASAAPAGDADAPPLTSLAGHPLQVHASARLSFELLGQRGPQPWAGVMGELLWLQDGSEYNARLSLKMLFKTIRTQTSVGRLDAGGIAPERFSETRRSEVASHLQREQGRVVFSNNAPSVPLLAGAQDRLSVVLQLGAMLAGDPARYPPGSQIVLQTVGPREAGVWTFRIEGSEEVTVPAGVYATQRISRAPRAEHDYRLELWLAPELGWLPVRMRQTLEDGDVIDLQLRGISPP